MGFFEKLLSKRKPDLIRARETFALIDGYTPVFKTFEGEIYESDLIRGSLDAHARHDAKLKLESNGTAAKSMRNKLMIRPNPWQTWPKFLYQCGTVLYTKNNLFLVPVFDEFGETDGIQCIVPNRFELVEAKDGTLYVRFHMSGSLPAAVELNKVGIITRFQVFDQIFGENNRALKDTLDLQQIQRQGIEEAVKNGASFRFYGRSTNFAKDKDLAKEKERFNSENFQRGGGGVLLFPNTVDNIHQVISRPYTVDAEQQRTISTNVFNYFGTNEDVLQNKAGGDKWAAFYEGGPEWFALNMGEAMTMMCFTERERSAGNRFDFSSNRLQYMTTQEKLNYVTSLGDRGLLRRNEAREVFNLPPLPAPYGDQIMARGEYYNIQEKEAESDA